jgi:hypothetical protein
MIQLCDDNGGNNSGLKIDATRVPNVHPGDSNPLACVHLLHFWRGI